MKNILNVVDNLKKIHSTSNPFKLCQKLNITLIFTDLPDTINSFFSNLLGNKIIYLNKNLNKQNLYIYCSHELGHAILHENSNTMFSTKSTDKLFKLQDYQANLFCVALLQPDLIKTNNIEHFNENLLALIKIESNLLNININNIYSKKTS